MYRETRRAIGHWLAAAASKRYNLRPDASIGCSVPEMIRHLGEKCHGIIHVGANSGQEFEQYRAADLECVVYIEPIPAVFAELQKHVASDKRHHAIQALCTDRSGDEYEFRVASNSGESSSIFPFGTHAELHPDVKFQSTIKLRSRTLDDVVFQTEGISTPSLDCLVMDVQGAEMKVIQGAPRTLAQCRFVFCEVNEGGLYEGDTPYFEILHALDSYGFGVRSLDLNDKGWGNAFLMKRRRP
jgi:FkbM family methyltransferase